MSLDVTRDTRRRWILVRGTGCVNLPEILTLIRTARANVEHQLWPMLVDARGATTTMTTQDVEAAVEAVRESLRMQGLRGHVGVVVDDDLFFERVLLYEARCADIGVRVIRVFRRLDDAERWLDIVSSARHFR